MDVLDPIDSNDNGEDYPEEDPDNDATSQANATKQRSVAEVSQCIEEHLLRSFVSMKNTDRRRLADSFSLPKVAATRTSSLSAVMSAQCSKNTKTLDKALAHIQTLNSDVLAPLTELLEQINGKKEVTIDQVGYAVESAITLLGNASTQMSTLH